MGGNIQTTGKKMYAGRVEIIQGNADDTMHVHRGSASTMGYAEHEAYGARLYQALTKVTGQSDGAVHDMILTVGEGVECSLWVKGISTTGMVLELYEGVTTQATHNDGTALTEFNVARTSTNTADVVATHTPTVDDSGLLLDVYQAGDKKAVGELTVAFWILKPSTKYRLKATSTAAGNTMIIVARWHEAYGAF